MSNEANDNNPNANLSSTDGTNDPAPMTRHPAVRHFLGALLPAIGAFVLSGQGQSPALIFALVLLLGFISGNLAEKMAAKSGQ